MKMMGRLRRSTRFSKNEIYVALLATLIGLWYGGVMPRGCVRGLIACGAFLVGLFCAVNAARDFKRMRWWERCGAAALLCLLVYATPIYLWDMATTTGYADR